MFLFYSSAQTVSPCKQNASRKAFKASFFKRKSSENLLVVRTGVGNLIAVAGRIPKLENYAWASVNFWLITKKQ